MVPTKILFGACAVAVGASECENTVVAVVNASTDACVVTDMTVDSDGWVYITTAPAAPSLPVASLCHSVTMCSPQGACTALTGSESDWASPSGIAVDSSDGRTVYISELGVAGGSPPDQPTRKGVKKCTFVGSTKLECIKFGEHWDSPHGLALDYDGNVLVTNAHDAPRPSNMKVTGAWKCTPSGQCVHLDGSGSGYFRERGVAADSKGNVFVSGYRTDGHHARTGSIAECSPHAACHEFDTPRTISGDVGLAVGSDDHLYIRDGIYFIRCSPDGTCEHIAACHGGLPSRVMAIHNGLIYSATYFGSHLQLRRFQFPIDNLQI